MNDFGPYRAKPLGQAPSEMTIYNVDGPPPVMVEMPCGGLPPEKKAFVNARDWKEPI